jgi:hypothetical protein
LVKQCFDLRGGPAVHNCLLQQQRFAAQPRTHPTLQLLLLYLLLLLHLLLL